MKLFPPPFSEHEELVDTEEESYPISGLELSEVELSTEPVMAFFHIRVRDAEGFAWTVMKRYSELVKFFETMRPLTGLPSLPSNMEEVSLVQDTDFHSLIEDQLEVLVLVPEVMRQQVFLDFFHVGEEYQRRVRKTPSIDDRNPRVVKRAKRLVEDVHRELRERSARERELLEQQSLGGSPSQSSEWRRQEIYRSDEQCDRLRMMSFRHIMRHPEWLCGHGRLPDSELQCIVAMQHYIDMDLKDLQLPEESRCYRDTFEGGCVSRQLLLDAVRSAYEVDGRQFNWPVLFAAHGRPADEEAILRRCFIESLVSAIMDSLGRGVVPPPLLVCAITSTLSQAGLANLDLACGAPHLVVSGGESRVHFSLLARADGAWDVTISTHKVGFESFVVCSAKDAPAADMRSRSCSNRSSILKLCTIRFTVQIGSGEVEANVLKLHKAIDVVDRRGRSLLGKETGCLTACLSGRSGAHRPARSTGALAQRLCSRGK